MNIEGLTVHVLTTELNQALSGGRIAKVLQPTRYLFVLKVRQPDQEHSLLLCIDPGAPRVHLTQDSRENPPEPSSFCMLLRKHLIDGRIAAVTQQAELDRVLHILVDIRGGQGKIDTKVLTVELAGKNSNLILCQNGLILDCARRVGFNSSRVRQIVPGTAYMPPPVKPRLNPLETSASELAAALAGTAEQPLSKSLMSTVAGIGPQGIAEILHRAGLKPADRFVALAPDGQAALIDAYRSFIEPHRQSPATAYVASDADGHLLMVGTFDPTSLTAARQQKFASLNAALAHAATLTAAPKTDLHLDTVHRVKSELEKLNRKLGLLTQELAESQNANDYRRFADLLLGNLPLLSTGLRTVQVPDLYAEELAPSGAAPMVEIELDPALAPMANVQRYYRKYARAKRGQELIQLQIDQCREDIRYLESVAVALAESISRQELLEVIQELADAGYIQASQRPRSHSKPSEPRKIVLPSGSVIFVGRNNRQNDLVTFKTAQPRDLWFHTKDIPGSHVILRSGGTVPSAPDIEKAAHLAAWFSKARESANVPVDYTERRYVKKPAGAKPGFVIYEKQKTLRVTPDSSMVDALLTQGVRPSSPG